MASIKPTVGRVVWFYPPTNSAQGGFAYPREGQPLAAVIAHVHSDVMLNLTVFDANGVPHGRTSVPLLADGGVPPVSGYYAAWMPYQKGQAAKTEELERAAAGSTAQPILPATTALRVTEEAIKDSIAGEYYVTADKAFGHDVPLLDGMELLTICVLVLKSGFTVTGTSACANPEIFDAATGRLYAREDAVRKIWPLLGFALKARIAEQSRQS